MSYTPPRRDLPQMAVDDDPIMDWDTEKSKELWWGVIIQAWKDAWGVDDSQTGATTRRLVIQDYARNWFRSENTAPASFVWACNSLGVNPDVVRSIVLTRHNGIRRRSATGQGWIQEVTRELQCQIAGHTASITRERRSTSSA